VVGAIFTIIAFLAIIGIGAQTLFIQVERGDYTILTEIQPNFFDESLSISSKDGF